MVAGHTCANFVSTVAQYAATAGAVGAATVDWMNHVPPGLCDAYNARYCFEHGSRDRDPRVRGQPKHVPGGRSRAPSTRPAGHDPT